MSQSGDPSSVGSDATSGISDTTFSDASLGSDLTGGGSLTGSGSSLFGGDTSSFGGGSFNDIMNALSGSGSPFTGPTGQAAAMSPPAAAAQTGGDPTGAASGTQSATTPGASPPAQTGNQSGQSQNQSGQGEYAPTQAVQELNKLLKALQGKPAGPTGQTAQPRAAPVLPGLAAGQTGPQSPGSFYGTPVQPMARMDEAAGLGGGPGGALQDVAGSAPAGASIPPGAAQQSTAQAADGTPRTDAEGEPVTAAGTPASQTPTPPARPDDLGTQVATDDQGRQITVRKPGAAAPQADLPTRVPHPDQTALPTHKPGAAPPPAAQPPTDEHSNIPPPRLIQDIAGISTGNPAALLDLAKAAGILAPVIGMMMGGGRRRGFQGMRGFRPFGARGGFGGHGGGFRHPPGHGGGMWLYHHPHMGWEAHHFHPGGGWLPMSPMDAQNMGLSGQDGQDGNNGLDPNRPPKETGADPGPANDTASGAIPGVTGKQVDDYTRQAALKHGIDPDIASKILAQESSYGQARRPGDDGTSFGPFQLHFAPDGRALGDQFVRDTGKDPRDPSTWKAQIDYAMLRAAMGGWGPWTNTMNKLGLKQWSGITTNRKFAGQPMTRDQPPVQIQVGPTTLPPSSQGMVAGP